MIAHGAASPSPVALVTGASRGIGRAVALELGRAGFAVVVNYAHAAAKADETVAALAASGATAVAIRADVGDVEAVRAMFREIDTRFGRLDALVNNAGVARRVDAITAIDDDTWRRTLAVNLDGAFFCMREAIPRFRARGAGRIVNVSSGAALTGGTIGAHYAASKAGLVALTVRAARELAADRIAVNAVLPSVIDTDMAAELAATAEARERLRSMIPIGRFGTAEEVAAVVRFLCVEAPDYLTGEAIGLRGGRA